MTSETAEEAAALRSEMAQLRRESARVVAAMQLPAQRKQRRELQRELEKCRKRGRALEPRVQALLASASEEDRGWLERDAHFLEQLRVFGVEPE